MPDATDTADAQAPIDYTSLLSLIHDLFRSTERMNDCFGVAVAAHQGRLPLDVINTETFVRDVAEIGFSEANYHLELLGMLCKPLHIEPFSIAHAAPAEPRRIQLKHH